MARNYNNDSSPGTSGLPLPDYKLKSFRPGGPFDDLTNNNFVDTLNGLKYIELTNSGRMKSPALMEPEQVYKMTYTNSGAANAANKDLESLLRAKGIYSREYLEQGMYNNFSRFGYNGVINPYNIPSVTKEYIFFTKPDLNILTRGENAITSGSFMGLNKDLQNYPFFTDAYSRYRSVLEDLCWSYSLRNDKDVLNTNTGINIYSNKMNNFIPLLTNTLASTVPLPDLSADYVDTNANVYGTRIKYRDSSSGDKNYTFSLEFQDTRFFEVYMFFRIYDEYIKLKNLGIVSPKSRQVWRKILHDQFSIYKITVDEDGTTITHFAKYTGVSPNSVPMSMFSDMNSTDFKGRLSVDFNAAFVEDMNPYILREFNAVSASPIGGIASLMRLKECELYDSNNDHANGDWPKYPYIYWEKIGTAGSIDTTSGGPRKYFLRWKYDYKESTGTQATSYTNARRGNGGR